MNQLQEAAVMLPQGVRTVSEESKKARTESKDVIIENAKLNQELPSLPTLAQIEEQYINQVLKAVGGSKEKAAKVLGVSVKTVYNKLNSYVKTKV